jgi:spore cortex biosynthesis protein YabQ
MSDMISWELHYLAVVVTLGAALAFFYDCFRILRRLVRHNTFWVALEDILFWMFASIATFIVCFMEDAGNVRWFAIAGEIAGALMYHVTISKFFVKYVSLVLFFPLKVLKKIIKSYKIKDNFK